VGRKPVMSATRLGGEHEIGEKMGNYVRKQTIMINNLKTGNFVLSPISSLAFSRQ
jgi:hypothetical protein